MFETIQLKEVMKEVVELKVVSLFIRVDTLMPICFQCRYDKKLAILLSALF